MKPVTHSLTVITTKIPHHSAHSGYEQLIHYLPESTQISYFKRGHAPTRFKRVIEAGLRLFTASRWYQWDGVLADLLSVKHLLKRNKVVHYLYGDSAIGLIPYIHSFLPGKLVLSIHACPDDLDEVLQYPFALKSIDAFIVLGHNQKEKLLKYGIENEKLHFIPHGVDLQFFKPLDFKPIQSTLNVLLVGNWRRNFKLYQKVIEASKNLPIQFHVVTQPFNYSYFRGLEQVKLYSSISDESLRSMYQYSDVLLMGVEDAVANNVILEAAACGLPIICEKVGAVTDYFDDNEITFTKPNAVEDIVTQFQHLIENRDLLQSKAENAYQKVKQYDWNIIAEETQRFVQSLFSK